MYAAVLVFAMPAVSRPQPGRATAYVNGRWFDGTSFDNRTAIVADGRLRFPARENADAQAGDRVDLAGGFVVPALCEGHNHNIAVGRPEERNARYLAAGVFYVQILNDAPDVAGTEAAFWSRPDTVDVVFAHAAVTGRGGHPVELIEGIARGGGYPRGTRLANSAYFEIRDPAEMEARWPMIVAARPDVVKLFLQFSDEYDRRRGDPAFYGNRGLSPAAFRRAVELAHRERRRVAAHVVSSADFHLAVDAGADVIAHLPGYMGPEFIAAADAASAARKRIAVVTTASLVRSFAKNNLPAAQDAQRTNLRLLKDAGVTLVVGSDSWSDTSHGEARYLRSLGVFSDIELLRMWTDNCARALFPDRRLGRLADGAEADFLVLDGNPLEDFEATRRIRLRIKRGVRLPG